MSYAYNHNSQRIQQTSGSDITYYLWDELSPYGDVVLETDSLNQPTVSYVLGGTQILSQTKYNYNPPDPVTTVTRYLLPDGQGSTRLLTNASGGAVATQAFEYSAFGDLLSTDAPDTSYLYTGQQYDAATDLYSLRARYYDPGVGHFLSRDTWAYDFQNPVELNRYVYAMGNPVNYADPTGMFAEFLGLLKTKIKELGGFTYLRNSWLEGAFYAGAGYLAGVGIYAALRAAVEVSIESALESICEPSSNSAVCRNTPNLHDGMVTSFDAKFREGLFVAFDLAEFTLTFLVGGFLNVANNLLMAVLPSLSEEVNLLKASTDDYRKISGITGQLGNWLMLTGSVASGLQSLSYGVLKQVPLDATASITGIFFSAMTNTMAIDTIGDSMSGRMKLVWNITGWTLATMFTRFGSPTDDIDEITRELNRLR